jgi:hypothetical protein
MKRFSFFISSTTGVLRAQLTEFLNGRINPESGYDDDVCVYVQNCPPDDAPKNSYYDFGDSYVRDSYAHGRLPLMKNVKIITMSKSIFEFMSKEVPNDVVLIPQHHCNFLEETREREGVTTVGIIGGRRSYEHSRAELAQVVYDRLRSRLKDIDVELLLCFHPRRRSVVVDFYKNIDVQIIYRPRRSAAKFGRIFSTALKMANACSFGVPTVSFPEMAYVDEFNKCFLQVITEEDVIKEVERLKEDPVLYSELSEKGIERAKKYHVKNIAKLFEEL